MYEPEVDDYVVWERPNGDWEEGWVYFKGDPVDNEKRIKDGWKVSSRYITIETGVRDKPNCMYSSGKPMRHRMIHTLLLCNQECWHELKYVKHRRTREIQHYSQYDDIAGNDEPAQTSSETMYKSQEGRLPDY
tara:strand:+ start:217 stop:615 length:399 start_codon:yes stop_codon:yes gene_type:complete